MVYLRNGSSLQFSCGDCVRKPMDKIQHEGYHFDSQIYLLLVLSRVIMAHIFYVRKCKRAKQEGISCVFHAPYYPQSNGMVERPNGLLERNLKPHETRWVTRFPKVLHQLKIDTGLLGAL